MSAIAAMPGLTDEGRTQLRQLHMPWTSSMVAPEEKAKAILSSNLMGSHIVIRGLTKGYAAPNGAHDTQQFSHISLNDQLDRYNQKRADSKDREWLVRR